MPWSMWDCLQNLAGRPASDSGAPSTSAPSHQLHHRGPTRTATASSTALRFELDQMANISGLLGHPLDHHGGRLTDTDKGRGPSASGSAVAVAAESCER